MCSLYVFRESVTRQHHSFHVEARDASEDEDYWESMGNIISGDKLELWDKIKDTLKQQQWVSTAHVHTANIHLYSDGFFCLFVSSAVLVEISEVVPETQSLKQQNAELRMLLQQSLNSRVCLCLCLVL